MKPDFAALRTRLGLLQQEAAALFKSHPRAWQYWEAGRPAPGPAQVLLEVLQWLQEAYPNVAAELLHKLKGEKK